MAGDTIYTIGHSTHSTGEFLAMLKSFDIALLVDIRRFPGSRKFPQFDQDRLEASLHQNGFSYCYIQGLGGRRKENKDSLNTRWKNKSFRAYADYMETEPFKTAVQELEELARACPTAIMCSEAVWWRCHRALVSDYLKAKGWKVMHITAVGKAVEHPYTSPALVVGDQVTYRQQERT